MIDQETKFWLKDCLDLLGGLISETEQFTGKVLVDFREQLATLEEDLEKMRVQD